MLSFGSSKYELVKELGKGLTAKVFKAYSVKDDDMNAQPFAVKQVSTKYPQYFDYEVKCLSIMEHKNVIKMEDYQYPNLGSPHQFILLEYCEYEFFDLVEAYQGLSENLANFYFRQFVAGTKHIHDKGYCHRDIKLANTFLTSEFQLKIADFSFGCELKGDQLTSKVGTKRYMAPELYAGYSYCGKKVDIFALGVTLFCMVMYKFPFYRARKGDQNYSKLMNNPQDFWNLYSVKPSQEFKDLIESLLKFDPQERPTLTAVLQHEWVNKYDISLKEVQRILKGKSQQHN